MRYQALKPRRADVIGDERPCELHPQVVTLHRADLEHQPRTIHQLHQILGLRRRRGHRLLDQDMLAGQESLRGQGVMEPVWRRDEHRLDRVVGPNRGRVGGGGRESVAAGDSAGNLGAGVADGHQLDPVGPFQSREVGDLRDAAAADEGETDGIGHV